MLWIRRWPHFSEVQRENVKTGAATRYWTRSTSSYVCFIRIVPSAEVAYMHGPVDKWFKSPHSHCGVTGSNPVGATNSKLVNMDANEKRMIEKIVANSFYEDYALSACAQRNFFFFNREIADTMTECGKSELRKLETLVDEIHRVL